MVVQPIMTEFYEIVTTSRLRRFDGSENTGLLPRRPEFVSHRLRSHYYVTYSSLNHGVFTKLKEVALLPKPQKSTNCCNVNVMQARKILPIEIDEFELEL